MAETESNTVDEAQRELEEELSEAARKVANKHGRTVAINALRNILRDMEGDLVSRDDFTPEEAEAIRDVISFAGGRIDESKHYSVAENYNTAVDALGMDYLQGKDVPEDW